MFSLPVEKTKNFALNPELVSAYTYGEMGVIQRRRAAVSLSTLRDNVKHSV